MNQLDYRYAKQRMKELHQEAAKMRLVKAQRLSLKAKLAKSLHSLAERLEPDSVLEAA
jgi:iron-sulfur cluster repair protein YtfE (RIC family)